jgi:hypothetical protein
MKKMWDRCSFTTHSLPEPAPPHNAPLLCFTCFANPHPQVIEPAWGCHKTAGGILHSEFIIHHSEFSPRNSYDCSINRRDNSATVGEAGYPPGYRT